MFEATVSLLACPGVASACGGPLALRCDAAAPSPRRDAGADVIAGLLTCRRCGASFPLVAGIAILLPDWRGYLQTRRDLLSDLPAADFPKEAAPADLLGRGPARHLATREWEDNSVLQAYLLAHFLPFAEVGMDGPDDLFASRRIAALMRRNVGRHPHALLADRVGGQCGAVLDLGCSVGGAIAALAAANSGAMTDSFLGLDISLRAVAAARRLLSGATAETSRLAPRGIKLSPEDWLPTLLRDVLSRRLVDFVVADAWSAPAAPGKWDLAIAINIVDFAPDLMGFLHRKASLLHPGGCCFSAAPLSRQSPVFTALSAAVEAADGPATDALVRAYKRAGFSLTERWDDIPWIMPRGPRCVEYFSVDALLLTREGPDSARTRC